MQNDRNFFEPLFNRNISEAGTVDFLKEITTAHPYYSPAQFYLLQQTNPDTNDFQKQALKTNLLFNNPHWLNFQLQTVDRVNEAEPIVEDADNPDVSLEADLPENTIAVELVAEVQEVDAVVEIPGSSIVDSALALADESADDTHLPEEATTELEPMKIELRMPQPQSNQDEALLFEPMHLVDYFASQGIKLSEEVQTADKLGKQLKSFTDWLKTMKKLHVEHDTDNGTVAHSSIEALAENSNTESEIITESMAEVFAKQGKTGKASELYKKLSLLNPAKSTYFAAKIETLKGI